MSFIATCTANKTQFNVKVVYKYHLLKACAYYSKFNKATKE